MKDKNGNGLSAFLTQYSENNTVDVLIDFRDYKLIKRSISPLIKSVLCRLSVIYLFKQLLIMNVDLLGEILVDIMLLISPLLKQKRKLVKHSSLGPVLEMENFTKRNASPNYWSIQRTI